MAGRRDRSDSAAVRGTRPTTARWLLGCVAWLAAPAFAATPQPGLWTIDAEQNGQPGRGMQIDVQNGALVLSFYGYRSDGSAQWYLSAGPLGANGYSGPLDRYAGGTPFGGTARRAVSDGSAGTVSLSFSDSTHGLITLPGESPKAITKLAFGGSTRRFKAEVWADNWFSLSVGERQVAEDSVPVTTERSFNSETFEFDASYPFDLNFVVKDYKQDDSGLEYIGLPNQQMGDGGFIMQCATWSPASWSPRPAAPCAAR